MSYQSDLYAALAGEASISAIVSDRIWSTVAPSTATAPYIVYSVVGTTGTTTHDGERPVEFPMIQIACWHTGPNLATTLASAVNAFVDGATIAGASNLSLVFAGQAGQYDDETKLFGEILEYTGATNTN